MSAQASRPAHPMDSSCDSERGSVATTFVVAVMIRCLNRPIWGAYPFKVTMAWGASISPNSVSTVTFFPGMKFRTLDRS